MPRCSVCPVKDQMIALLQEQLAAERAEKQRISDQLVNLADPLIHARLNSARTPVVQQPADQKRTPALTPTLVRRTNPDRPTPEQVASFKSDLAAEPKSHAPSIESTFEIKTG